MQSPNSTSNTAASSGICFSRQDKAVARLGPAAYWRYVRSPRRGTNAVWPPENKFRSGYWADVVSTSDFYPFGMGMVERGDDGGYRYGFNGKEKDGEGMGGGGSTYDYGFRIYNPGLGRFLSVDPLMKDFPFYTPYQFAGNKPIVALDLDGREDLHYGKFQKGMIEGVFKFKSVPFPTIEPKIWQDPELYRNNPYWARAASTMNVHPSTLVLREGVSPSDRINHIFNNPKMYTMDCAQFVQVVKFYGMLQSMGSEDFDNFIREQSGDFLLSNHNSSRINYSDVYVNELGIWSPELPKNEKKLLKDAPIGTEVALRTEALRCTVYYTENIVKVGDDEYFAQGITGDTPLSLDDIKNSLAEKGGVDNKDVYVKEIKIPAANVQE